MASQTQSGLQTSTPSGTNQVVIHPDQLLSAVQFLPLKDNNHTFSPDTFKCEHQVIVEILKRHYIRHALTKSPSVPLIYVQQLWNTLAYISDPEDNKHYFRGEVDKYEVTFTLRRFRSMLHLRASRAWPGKEDFDDLPTEDELCDDIMHLGYSGPLTKASTFKRMYLTPLWCTLFSIINRCLTSKHTGLDSCSISVLRIFHGIVYNKHYDYAELIWNELIEVVRVKGIATKARKFVPFQRFLQIIISELMRQHAQIPARVTEPKIPLFVMQYLRKDCGDQFIPATQISEDLLAYADQSAPSVIAYRQSITSMVPLEPVEPPQGAPLELRGESLALGEQYQATSGDLDHEGQMENSERGVGDGGTDSQSTFSQEELQDITTISDVESQSDSSNGDSETDNGQDNDNNQDDDSQNDYTQVENPYIPSFDNELIDSEGGVVNYERLIEERVTRLKENENLSQTKSVRWVATSATGIHALNSGIEEDVMNPVTQTLTQLRHSSPQQGFESISHGDLTHTLSTFHPENVDIETGGQFPMSPTSFSIPPNTKTLKSDMVETSIVKLIIGSSHGLENVGHVIDSTIVSTGTDTSPKQLKTFTRRKIDKGIVISDPQRPPPPHPQTHIQQPADLLVDELKQLLLAKLISQSSTASEDIELIRILQSQQAVFQNVATKADVNRLGKEIRSSTILITEELKRLTDKIESFEQTCKSQAQGSKRKHDDQDDHDHHEGEKRQRVDKNVNLLNVQAATEEPNVETTQGSQPEHVENLQMVVFQNPNVEPMTVDKPEGSGVIRGETNKLFTLIHMNIKKMLC